MRALKFALFLSCVLGLVTAAPAKAQSTEERFHDLFLTAGYSTAFGAALGAAFLSFTEDPSSELRYVAIGASLGFIGGSILGSYVIFQPMLVENPQDTNKYALLEKPTPGHKPQIAIRPAFEKDNGYRFAALEGGLTYSF